MPAAEYSSCCAQRLQGAMLRSSEGGIGIRIGPRPYSYCRTRLDVDHYSYSYYPYPYPNFPTLVHIPAPARPCPRILEKLYRRVPGPRPYLHLPCLPIPILRAPIPAYSLRAPPFPLIARKRESSRSMLRSVRSDGSARSTYRPLSSLAQTRFSRLSFHPCVGCACLALIAPFPIQSSLKIRSASSRHRRRSSPDCVSTQSTPEGRSPPPAA